MNDFFQPPGCSPAFRRFQRYLFKRCTKDDDQVRGESILLTLLLISVRLSVCLSLFLSSNEFMDRLTVPRLLNVVLKSHFLPFFTF